MKHNNSDVRPRQEAGPQTGYRVHSSWQVNARTQFTLTTSSSLESMILVSKPIYTTSSNPKITPRNTSNIPSHAGYHWQCAHHIEIAHQWPNIRVSGTGMPIFQHTDFQGVTKWYLRHLHHEHYPAVSMLQWQLTIDVVTNTKVGN